MKETFLYKAFYDTNLDNEVITLIDCKEAMDKYTKFMSLGFMDYYWKFKEVNGHKLTAEG